MTHALIIDDNRKNADVLARLLAEDEISSTKIIESANLESMVDTIEQIHIVFLDLEMPDMDGYDIIHLLNTNARFQSVPIVAYTVHVSEINEASRRGFHSFLGKPLDPDKFSDQLARILSGERVWETV